MSEKDKHELSLPSLVEPAKAQLITLVDGCVKNQTDASEPFDAESISHQRRVELEELKKNIINGHRELTVLAVCSAAKALQIGSYVLRAKEILEHGKFLPWIDAEVTPNCRLARRTIQRYTKLARESNRLIERIRQLYSLGNEQSLDFEGASRLLETLQLEDALSILRFGMLKEPQSDPDEEEVMDDFEQAAQKFFGLAKVPFSAYLTWDANPADQLTGYQFISPCDSRKNRQAVIASVAAYRSGDLPEALLLLSGGGSDRWLRELDEFPRVLLRQADESDSPSSGTVIHKRFLFGLIGPDRFSDFNEAFETLGAVLVPFVR